MFPKYKDNTREDMAVLLPQEYRRVLEIGCAEGSFSRNLVKAQETWGVEINPNAAAEAVKKFDHILVGDFCSNAASLPDNYFDLVVCNDVIEHIPDHLGFLCVVNNKILYNGTLLISVPNVRCSAVLFEILFRREWRYRPSGLLDYTHVRYFTRKSIIRSLSDSGFICEAVICKSASYRSLFKRIAITVIGFLSFGFFSDIGCIQFLIRSRKFASSKMQ